MLSTRAIGIAGFTVALAYYYDKLTSGESVLVLLLLVLVKVFVGGVGGVLVCWASGRYAALVRIMSENEDDPRVQWLGCGAIGWGRVNMKKLLAIADTGGVDVILSAMRAHKIYHGVQKEGCAAIMSLAQDTTVNALIIESGGVDCIMDAMKFGAAGSQKTNEASLARISLPGVAPISRVSLPGSPPSFCPPSFHPSANRIRLPPGHPRQRVRSADEPRHLARKQESNHGRRRHGRGTRLYEEVCEQPENTRACLVRHCQPYAGATRDPSSRGKGWVRWLRRFGFKG
jgi:hypothetical protein